MRPLLAHVFPQNQRSNISAASRDFVLRHCGTRQERDETAKRNGDKTRAPNAPFALWMHIVLPVERLQSRVSAV